VKRARRGFTFVLLVLGALCACAAASGPRAVPGAADDVRLFVSRIEALHPEPYVAISREEFHRRADALAARAPTLEREELVVELMRLIAALGDRNGHTGIFPADGHSPPLHLYPLKLYDFSDGLFVIDSDVSALGARVVAVDGIPIADVRDTLRPLIFGDNDWTRRMHLPAYVVAAELLHGLGITRRAERATFTLETSVGRRDVELTAIEGPEHARRFGFAWQLQPVGIAKPPLWLQNASKVQAVRTLQRGRVVYATYNAVGWSEPLARKIRTLARKRAFRRLVLDVRLNGGGNNTKYGPLLEALRSRPVNRHFRPAVLVGRVTFSAAGNFAAEVDLSTPARLVGEPTGGAPNQWGDSTAVELPHIGLRFYVATTWVQRGAPGDPRITNEPDVRVDLSSADWFAGRDPVLAAALVLPLR
jgi:hypothetical protein